MTDSEKSNTRLFSLQDVHALMCLAYRRGFRREHELSIEWLLAMPDELIREWDEGRSAAEPFSPVRIAGLPADGRDA